MTALASLAALLALAPATGCSNSGRTAPTEVSRSAPQDQGEPTRLVRLETRVNTARTFAWPGADLVLVHEPSEPVPPRSIWIPRVESAPTLTNGTPLRSSTFALIPTPDPTPRTDAERWLGQAFTYDVLPITEVAANPDGALQRLSSGAAVAWLTLVELPSAVDAVATPAALPHDNLDLPGLSQSVQGFNVQLGRSAVPVRFLPAGTWAAAAPAPQLSTPFAEGLSELEAAERRSTLAEALYRAATDPLRRWRLELLADARPDLDLARLSLQTLDDPRLRRVARATAARWRLAINRLAETSPELARNLTARLTAVSELTSGAWLPMWPPPSSEDQRLLTVLLDPRTPAREREDAATRWLADRPTFVAAIAEDSTPGSTPAARIGIIDISGAAGSAPTQARGNAFFPTTVSSAGPFRTATADLRPLPPTDADDPLASLRESPDPRTAEQILLLRTDGVWELAAPADPVPVARPGLITGPLLPAWSRDALFAGAPRAVDRDGATMLVVRRGADGAWSVHVECGDTRPGDTVTIYADSQRIDRTPAQGNTLPGGGWTASAVLRPSVVGDGVVRLAVTRRDTSGVITAWPRPMLPLQQQPGRIAIDLTRWTGAGLASE